MLTELVKGTSIETGGRGSTKVQMKKQMVNIDDGVSLISTDDLFNLEDMLKNPKSSHSYLKPISSQYKPSGGRKVTSRGIGALQESEIDEVFDMLKNNVKDNESGILGVCVHCSIPILIQYCEALGKKYHTEHFFCSKCNKVIAADKYFVTDQNIWCVDCFDRIKGGVCAGCNEIIAGNFIVALDKKWHPEHFGCTVCKQQFKTGKCMEKDGKPYCEKHYKEKFLRCKLCNEVIVGKVITALDSVWHEEHVACKVCLKPYTQGFFTHEGFIYCPIHFTEMQKKKN